MATVIVTAPLLLYSIRLCLIRPEIFFGNDVALVEIATRDAADGSQLLGPYSRFGWHHPGPAWFYWLSVPYRLSGSQSWAVLVGMCAFHIAVTAAILIVANRQGGRRLALLLAALLVVYIRAVDINLFLYPWNPWALILPMALLVLLSARSSAPLPRLLWMCALGSVLVQTHLGTAPTVLAVIGAAGVVAWRRDRRSGWGSTRAIAVPAVVVCALWFPPFLEQITEGTGNVGLILNFFRAERPGHGVGESIALVGSQLRRFPFERGRVVNDLVPLHSGDSLVLAAYLGLVLIIVVFGHRQRDDFAFRLGIVSGVALVTSVLAVSRITGGAFDFLLTWVSVLTVPLWVAAATLAVGQWPRNPSARQFGAGALVVFTALVAASISRPVTQKVLGTPDISEVRSSWPEVRAALGSPKRAVLIRIVDNDQWSMGAGLALQLEKDGWPVAVTDSWLFMFGANYRASGQERVAVELRDRDRAAGAQFLTSGGTAIDIVPVED